jgi:hypothetical protein
MESASPDTPPSHQVLHAVPAMVGEGSLCDSTVDRQSNSPMRKHFGRAPGLHHEMALADVVCQTSGNVDPAVNGEAFNVC